MPTFASRARSAGVKMPLSPTTTRSSGTRGASRSADLERGDEGLEVAVIDADERRFEPERTLELGVVVHLEQHVHAEPIAAASISAAAPSSSAAMMMRMQSAPIARASATWYGSYMKSLRSTGRSVAARAATRNSGEPWNEGPSVRTERQAAPPAS